MGIQRHKTIEYTHNLKMTGTRFVMAHRIQPLTELPQHVAPVPRFGRIFDYICLVHIPFAFAFPSHVFDSVAISSPLQAKPQ